MIYKVICKTKSGPPLGVFVNAFSEADAMKRAAENLDARVYDVVSASEFTETDKIIKGILTY